MVHEVKIEKWNATWYVRFTILTRCRLRWITYYVEPGSDSGEWRWLPRAEISFLCRVEDNNRQTHLIRSGYIGVHKTNQSACRSVRQPQYNQ